MSVQWVSPTEVTATWQVPEEAWREMTIAQPEQSITITLRKRWPDRFHRGQAVSLDFMVGGAGYRLYRYRNRMTVRGKMLRRL